MSKIPKTRSQIKTVKLASSKRPSSTRLYAAKLLFEFRVVAGKSRNRMRLCEERIVLVDHSSALRALRQVERQAKTDKLDYHNSDGSKVLFRFVGVLDLLHLDFECEPNEVWYDLSRRLLPMERRRSILPKRTDLHAIRWERLHKPSK